MSRMMLLGALRAHINVFSTIEISQLQARAREAADVIEAQDEEIARLREALESLDTAARYCQRAFPPIKIDAALREALERSCAALQLARLTSPGSH